MKQLSPILKTLGRAASRASVVALVWYLSGCASSLAFQSIYAQNNQLSVRGSTQITIAASSLPGQTIHYKVTAARGRIYQSSDTSNVITYYAPFTSQALDANGNMQPGDTLQIQISDNTGTRYQTYTINLVGETLVFKEDSQNCSSDSSVDCNGTLYAGTVDQQGFGITDIRPLADSTGKALEGAQPAVSPDGRRIAYVYYPGNGTSAIYTVDAAGQTNNLTGSQPGSGFNIDPTWSPYGDQIAYASDTANSGVFNLYRIPADQQAGNAIRITTSSISQRYPSWNPAGAKGNILAVSAQAILGPQGNLVASPAWNLFTLDLNSGRFLSQLSNLSEAGLAGPDFALEAHWDPTGQSLAYTQRGPVAGNQTAAARFERIVVQCAGSGPGSAVLLNPTQGPDTTLAESNPLWNPGNGSQVAYLHYTVDQQGTPATPALFLGTPPALCGSTQPSTGMQGPRQWGSISQQIPALHVLSTSGEPVGGNEMDWR